MPQITEPDDTRVITDRLYPPSVAVTTAWHRYGQCHGAWQRPADQPEDSEVPASTLVGEQTTA